MNDKTWKLCNSLGDVRCLYKFAGAMFVISGTHAALDNRRAAVYSYALGTGFLVMSKLDDKFTYK